MIRLPPRSTLTYTLSPYTTLFRSLEHSAGKPDILITVDNGIASTDGVDAALRAGMEVIVTDHHLPGDTLPRAIAIVNPNRSEEHTSELQSLMRISYAVFCLKKKQKHIHQTCQAK